MSDFLDHATHIRLQIERCHDCGRFWAHETARDATCPVCAESRVRRAHAEQDRLERSNRSLRGAVSRLKARQS